MFNFIYKYNLVSIIIVFVLAFDSNFSVIFNNLNQNEVNLIFKSNNISNKKTLINNSSVKIDFNLSNQKNIFSYDIKHSITNQTLLNKEQIIWSYEYLYKDYLDNINQTIIK